MIKEEIYNFRKNKCCTLLGVGPMSLNCVNATIDIANTYEIPIFLISSRRQIDSKKQGSGYVNNWDTETFANYVSGRDKKNFIYLSRDHGGPWQNPIENKYSLNEAMESAKYSYTKDIEAGYKIIHIDPSIEPNKKPSLNQILERVFELYEHCWAESNRLNKDIAFEVGTEEQTSSTNTFESFEYTLNEVKKFCNSNKLPTPLFMVAQTGTKVMEMRNIGSFELPLRIKNQLPSEILLPKVLEICGRYNVLMKEHNADYLSNASLGWHPRLGIHAANVAPEFGVKESKTFLEILEKNNFNHLSEKFIELALESKKWEKWIIKNSCASLKEKALISGHYIFSTPKFIEIKNEAIKALAKKGLDLDAILYSEVKKSILRYIKNFKII
tara:strand:+ start:139 stop:1293 length:1155 start_codon:yes stop_codon:yes gene_type:complete